MTTKSSDPSCRIYRTSYSAKNSHTTRFATRRSWASRVWSAPAVAEQFKISWTSGKLTSYWKSFYAFCKSSLTKFCSTSRQAKDKSTSCTIRKEPIIIYWTEWTRKPRCSTRWQRSWKTKSSSTLHFLRYRPLSSFWSHFWRKSSNRRLKNWCALILFRFSKPTFKSI